MAYLGTFDAYWIDLPNNQIYKVDFQHHSDFIRNNANLLPDPAEAQRNPYKAAYDSGWVHLVYNYENQESNIEGHEDKIKASWRKVKSTLLKSKRIYVDIVKPGKREATKQKEFGLPHQRDKVFMYFTGQADPTSVRIESLMERTGIDIEINADKYADYVSYYLEELQASSQRRFDAGHTQHLYSKEETERDVSALIGGTMENMKVMKEKISSMYAKFSTKWQGTTLLIMPHFNKGNDFSFNPCDDFTIKFGTHPYAPDFTLFDMGSMIEDVLDAGDKDFFVDSSVESDYFTLVQAFQDPGIFDMGEKVVTLYTARPREQRGIYDGSTTIPTNIFLTNDPDEAFGYAQDMNGRDVYKIKVKQKYLVKTLDAGSKKNYQTVNGPSGIVPIDLIDRLTEGFTQHIVENISWETWWFHPEKGIITLNGAENQHWWYVIEHYKKMGIDIGTIVQKYNGDIDALYDDDHDWYAIKTNAYKAGWVRMGLINGTKAYVNSLQKVPAKAAANWLYNKSGGHMTSLELEICSQKVNVRLRDDMLEKFLSKGIIGKGAEKLDENEMSIASFRGYAGWFRNDVGFVPLDEHYHTMDVVMHPDKYQLSIEEIMDTCPSVAHAVEKAGGKVTDDPIIVENDQVFEYMNKLGWSRIGYQKFSQAVTIVSPNVREMRKAIMGFGEKFSELKFDTVFYRLNDTGQEGSIMGDDLDLFIDKGRLPRVQFGHQKMFSSLVNDGLVITEFQLSDLENYEQKIGNTENAKKIVGHMWNKPKMLVRLMNGFSKNPQDILKAAAARMLHKHLLAHPEILKPVEEADQYDMFTPDFNDLADKVWRFVYDNRISKQEIKAVAKGFLWNMLIDMKYKKLWDSRDELAAAMKKNVKDHQMYREIYNFLTTKGY